MSALTCNNLRPFVHKTADETPILDIHTHICPPRFGELLLWGVDELVTYHYLIAEVFRVAPMPYDQWWAMSKPQQADHIWKHLFIERSPISEACRGVLTVLNKLGIDATQRNLNEIRAYFAATSAEAYVDTVFKTANVKSVIMTNDPFDDIERRVWLDGGAETDPRFQAVLRIDPLLTDWTNTADRLKAWGYDVKGDLGQSDVAAVRTFLTEWIERINPRYLAVSLTPDFQYPDEGPCGRLIDTCVLPVTKEAAIPFAMMIGVQRQINPDLQLAGDAVGKADVRAVERLCIHHPDNRFLVTMLSRENQHELCIVARKMPNLHLFGCWWFLNNPSIIEEITRERFELLGLSVTPQHSDARVLDQILYKWTHSRRIIADVLADKYDDLLATGWTITEAEVKRDIEAIFGGEFERFCATARS